MPANVGATLALTRKPDADVKPKKLILSRKGFDSGSGGCPSPIFPDGTMFSLPISSGDREQFDDLQHGDVNIASVVAGITGGRLNGKQRVHLDPDLNFETYRYRKTRAAWQQWLGMLGQTSIAQAHLDKQGVGNGDVFLFFGLYRLVGETTQGWRFIRSTPELHVLWGLLQVDRKYGVADIAPDIQTVSVKNDACGTKPSPWAGPPTCTPASACCCSDSHTCAAWSPASTAWMTPTGIRLCPRDARPRYHLNRWYPIANQNLRTPR